ncbi:MAG: hypothetical protein A2X94_11130 [Bdellovibrionales bacterium GWB1_55_8]|nr:MAG: hypothetical protein A2X94_11130 [Bdellovibrionales bacterium GWB1_55_8]
MPMPRFRDYYDWVVLGDHPGALLSASLAAKLGLSALIVPLGPSLARRISDSGQCFDPESNFLTGLRNLVHSKGLLADCLARAGITSAEEQSIRKQGVLPQILTPDARIELALDDRTLEFECERELGKSGANRFGMAHVLRESEQEFLKYWSALPERLTWTSVKSTKASKNASNFSIKTADAFDIENLLSRLRKSSVISADLKESWFVSGIKASGYMPTAAGNGEFDELCSGLWYGTTGEFAGEPTLSDLLHALAIARTGASFKGGMHAYREFLIRIARRCGVHVAQSECRRIFVERGRFVGVQVAQYGTMIGAGAGAFGCLLNTAGEQIVVDGRQVSKKLKNSPEPSGWKFSIALSVHSEAIPPGMSDRMIWQERGAPPLEIEVAAHGDYGIREFETKLIHLRTVLPFKDETLNPAYQIMIATRMLRQVLAVVPFIEYHVTRIYPDFRKAHPSLDSQIDSKRTESAEYQTAVAELKEAYPFSTLADIPMNLRCYSGKGVGSRSGVEGLFVTSDEAYPQLGSLGGTVSAIEAVAWMAHRSGLAGPLV